MNIPFVPDSIQLDRQHRNNLIDTKDVYKTKCKGNGMVTEISIFTQVKTNIPLTVDPETRAVFHPFYKQAQLPCKVDHAKKDVIQFIFSNNKAFYWEAKDKCELIPISTHISFQEMEGSFFHTT